MCACICSKSRLWHSAAIQFSIYLACFHNSYIHVIHVGSTRIPSAWICGVWSIYLERSAEHSQTQFTLLPTFRRHLKHFYARKQLCFQRVLAIAILSVRLSVTRVDQAKTVQARTTKSSPSAARKTLVSGTVKLFHKFEGGHPE